MDHLDWKSVFGGSRGKRGATRLPAIRRKVGFDREVIEYTLVRSDRRSTEFAVRPDCTVLVRAPLAATPETIDRKVVARGRWILEHLAYFRHYAPRRTERRFLPGETHLLLGKGYRLVLEEGTRPAVRLEEDRIIATLPGAPDPEKTRVLLEKWYREEAPAVFQASLDRCWAAFAEDGYPRPHLVIRKMKRCWGTMSRDGKMTLNLDLVRAAPGCIDYVVTHELCHLAHPNHGKGFYRQLGERMADWAERKRDLETSLA